MENCIFCRIITGEVPCYKVWEDDKFLAFLDVHPVEAGHTLMIPKKHYPLVWEVENYAEYFEKVREVKEILEGKLKPVFVEMRILGMQIPHAHIHLIPHQSSVGMEKSDFEQIIKLLAG